MNVIYEERVIWSPRHGGCLMIQRRYLDAHTAVSRAVGPGWHDWTSGCEGEWRNRKTRSA